VSQCCAYRRSAVGDSIWAGWHRPSSSHLVRGVGGVCWGQEGWAGKGKSGAGISCARRVLVLLVLQGSRFFMIITNCKWACASTFWVWGYITPCVDQWLVVYTLHHEYYHRIAKMMHYQQTALGKISRQHCRYLSSSCQPFVRCAATFLQTQQLT